MQQITETGIDISNFIAQRAAGLAVISKPMPDSQNYVFSNAVKVVENVNGVDAIVTKFTNPKNINRQSIADLSAQLDAQQAHINAARLQVAAVVAEIDALDAEVVV